ncbi:MAG: spermidine synthase [Burkholderiales bacterium PBB4]|nr:MAG: spermidine synthase [Burkholderiales bacterium PBB4]
MQAWALWFCHVSLKEAPMSDAAGAPLTSHPQVHETLGGKTLFFNDDHVQSEMRFAAPDALEFEYTQLMMGFLLWVPDPRTLGMVGLGGGSLAKYCYRYLPSVRTTVIEIHPGVIALRDAFQIPPDDARLKVVCADAATYLGQTAQRFDVLLVDGFDAQGLPAALSTPQFYADCLEALTPQGVAVFNLHRCDTLFDVVLDRLRAAFGGALCLVDDSGASNCLAFACKATEAHAGSTRLPLAALRRPNALDPRAWRALLPLMQRVMAAAAEAER